MPIRAAQQKDYKYSYLMDMQALFQPALSDGCILYRLIHSFGDVSREEKENHYRLLKDFLWNTIEHYTTRVAAAKDEAVEATETDCIEDAAPEVPQAKKAWLEGPTLALLETLVATRRNTAAATTLSPTATANGKSSITSTYPEINGKIWGDSKLMAKQDGLQ